MKALYVKGTLVDVIDFRSHINYILRELFNEAWKLTDR